MHCTEAGWNKLHAVHASGVGLFSTLLTLPSFGKCFIHLWRSRTMGIIQGKIDDKGYYVRCNIHFPNNNVGEGEVMRAEQYYPTICSLPPLGLSLVTGLLSIYSIWLMCSLSFSTHPHLALPLLTLWFPRSILWSSLSVLSEIPVIVQNLISPHLGISRTYAH